MTWKLHNFHAMQLYVDDQPLRGRLARLWRLLSGTSAGSTSALGVLPRSLLLGVRFSGCFPLSFFLSLPFLSFLPFLLSLFPFLSLPFFGGFGSFGFGSFGFFSLASLTSNLDTIVRYGHEGTSDGMDTSTCANLGQIKSNIWFGPWLVLTFQCEKVSAPKIDKRGIPIPIATFVDIWSVIAKYFQESNPSPHSSHWRSFLWALAQDIQSHHVYKYESTYII